MKNGTESRENHFAITSITVKPSPSRNSVMPSSTQSSWTFFSNHAHVLLCLHKNGDSILREVAAEVGITERAVQKIVAELEAAGILNRTREGRRNRYSINKDVQLRHSIEAHRSVGDMLNFIFSD